MIWKLFMFFVMLVIASCTHRPMEPEVVPTVSRTGPIPLYDVFELSVQHNGAYENNFFDVTSDVVFTSPTGLKHRIKGFFYGGEFWKARFRPDEPGRWTYTYLLRGRGGFSQDGQGSFECTSSDTEGLVRPHPENPYRWVFAGGKPYFPIGLQDCFDAQLSTRMIDGEMERGKGRKVSLEEYFSIYGRAGFNLFRFSQKNCSYSLYDDLDHYRESESIITDQLLSVAHKHGFRIMFGFFGFDPIWTGIGSLQGPGGRSVGKEPETIEKAEMPDKEEILSKQKRFIGYAVARWGVYVDFWQLLNEQKASDDWTTLMAEYVRSVDPDRKPISTSWGKPHLAAIEINAPHWYESEGEFQSDLRVVQQANKWKQAGKPVIVGEQGNTGMNWDPLSGLRMRIRAWTALFREISLIFWNTSWSKAGMFGGRHTPGHGANIYLGPEERGYIRVLQDFASRLDAGLEMVEIEVSFPDRVRSYGLRSDRMAAAYLHHFENHASLVSGAKITLDIPRANHLGEKLFGEWIAPSTGKVLGRMLVAPGRQTLNVPTFAVDLAFLITTDRDTRSPSRLN